MGTAFVLASTPHSLRVAIQSSCHQATSRISSALRTAALPPSPLCRAPIVACSVPPPSCRIRRSIVLCTPIRPCTLHLFRTYVLFHLCVPLYLPHLIPSPSSHYRLGHRRRIRVHVPLPGPRLVWQGALRPPLDAHLLSRGRASH